VLRIVEEILLLLIDGERGDIRASLSTHTRDVALSGAVLMDLAMENRIDTDLRHLMLIDPTPLGDELLDPALAEIAHESGTHSTAFWISRMAERGDELLGVTTDRLVERGILEVESNGLVFLSRLVSRVRRYPTDAGAGFSEEVQSRIMRQLFSDDIPDPRDIVIISLAAACGVFPRILSREELAEVQGRIDRITRMELIGRTVAAAVAEIEPPAAAFPVVRPYEEIPKVSGWPLVGSAFAMESDLRGLLLREYQRHGPIFRVQALNRRFVALVGPEATTFLNKEGSTLLRSFEEWSVFREAFGSSHLLTDMDGREHIRMRKALSPGYSRQSVQGRYDELVDITRRVVSAWPQGKSIAPVPAFQRIIAEQIGLLLTGVSPGESLDSVQYYLLTLMRTMQRKSNSSLLRFRPRYRRAEKRTIELLNRVLEAHSSDGTELDEEADFIDILLHLHRTDPTLLPETNFRFAFLGPFFAGIDTAAIVCSYMLYALLSDPELLERMRSEVAGVFTGEPLTSESFGKLTTTRRILLETQRMYPAIPGAVRVVSNSFEFGGYKVPAGKRVLVGFTAAHHLPECFPEPDRFDIGRFAEDRAEHRQPGAYAPFGFGGHRCLGIGFAEVQIVLTMATIVHEMELALMRPNRPLRTRQVTTIRPVYRFRLTERRGA
jgi:cytochrome P450